MRPLKLGGVGGISVALLFGFVARGAAMGRAPDRHTAVEHVHLVGREQKAPDRQELVLRGHEQCGHPRYQRRVGRLYESREQAAALSNERDRIRAYHDALCGGTDTRLEETGAR